MGRGSAGREFPDASSRPAATGGSELGRQKPLGNGDDRPPQAAWDENPGAVTKILVDCSTAA
jgi:hypothetical protein